jgi:hypothetical protein
MKKLLLLAVMLGFVLSGCSPSNLIVKNDTVELTLRSSEQLSPKVYKAEVEFLFLKDQRKDRETMKLDCNTWKITIMERVSFGKDGKVIGMSKFNVNNEFEVKPDTFGQEVFKHFCVTK